MRALLSIGKDRERMLVRLGVMVLATASIAVGVSAVTQPERQSPTVLASTTLAAATYDPGNPPEEAPPGNFGLVVSTVLLVVLLLGVTGGMRLTRRRSDRLRSRARAEDPLEREALLAGARLFGELEPAWAARDGARLGRLIGPELLGRWRPRLHGGESDSVAVDGPVLFEYLGPGAPGPPGERRVLIRIQGRLRPSSHGRALGAPQRKVLIGIAAVILTASFVGIALAPATKIRSAGPTTILVQAGLPIGGVYRLTYKRGAVIDITVRSNGADTVLLHGYGRRSELPLGGAAHLRLRATIEGSFGLELVDEGETIANVTVEP
jgi:hypothetical protein